VKVLIADDDRTIRALLHDLLVDMGHEVVAAENGAEAVELCERERPDVAILDFLMPRLSGLDALQEMRRRGCSQAVVLLTAISDASLRDVRGADQPDAVLEKPFKRKGIEKAIEDAVAKAARRG
jgi:CheY-like chemotaxis protein